MEKIIKIKTSRDDYDIRDSAYSSISVGEVIEILENFPKEAKIVLSNDNDYIFGIIRKSSFKQVEVETYQEEKEREKEDELNEIKDIINTIKKIVIEQGGEILLAMDGISLNTCCDEQENNLIVTELTTKISGLLYGNTNWGLINLENTITDLDDWYTLDDITADL